MSSHPVDPPPAPYTTHSPEYGSDEKRFADEKGDTEHGEAFDVQEGSDNKLSRDLQGRHMQMIAIGGAIGAGLFVGSGLALEEGGPGSLVLSFLIVGFMLMIVIQCLAELAVMYPINGAFFSYAVRFVDESWGFAIGWDYAISWLTVLPFEITAAGITIGYWNKAANINIGVWVTIFLVVLSIIQIFGVRGYGEVEFVLSMIKIIACTGFIILGIVIDCGGVSTDTRGYIGARYWHNPGAFNNGFKGFCSNFVNAAFAYGGTELVGLAAAEAANPLRSIPRAAKQVFFRILFFYVVSLFILGLIVPSNASILLQASGSNSSASPYTYAIELAGIKGLPSVFNAVITISVISVANSCTFGSTRTIQALAATNMAPKFLAHIDKHGRPIWCVLLQIAFGFLAFINEASSAGNNFFSWLLALSGLAYFFIWGTICLSHIRFRAAWKYHGYSVNAIPYRSPFGIVGSYIGLLMNFICIMAVFYYGLFPIGATRASAFDFFNYNLAMFLILALYLFWKVYSRNWRLYIPLAEIDVTTGLRGNLADLLAEGEALKQEKTWANLPIRVFRTLF